MKINSTIYKWLVAIILNQFILTGSYASSFTYCSPTFVNGCNLWNNQSISIGTINWSLGTTSCTLSDYTSMSTTLDAGVSYPMAVTSGAWCGCAVWVDFNNDQVFDSTENLYYKYGNASPYTYNFNLTIPAFVNSGTYTMRVVAGWGTDCFTVSTNGYGPCGSYQYGNFDDFTVIVVNTGTGIPTTKDNSIASIEAYPNPTFSSVIVKLNDFPGNDASLQLLDITGKIIRSMPVRKEKEELDMSDLSKGIYILQYVDGLQRKSIRLVK